VIAKLIQFQFPQTDIRSGIAKTSRTILSSRIVLAVHPVAQLLKIPLNWKRAVVGSRRQVQVDLSGLPDLSITHGGASTMSIPRVLGMHIDLLREEVLRIRIMRLSVGQDCIATQLGVLLTLVSSTAEVERVGRTAGAAVRRAEAR